MFMDSSCSARAFEAVRVASDRAFRRTRRSGVPAHVHLLALDIDVVHNASALHRDTDAAATRIALALMPDLCSSQTPPADVLSAMRAVVKHRRKGALRVLAAFVRTRCAHWTRIDVCQAVCIVCQSGNARAMRAMLRDDRAVVDADLIAAAAHLRSTRILNVLLDHTRSRHQDVRAAVCAALEPYPFLRAGRKAVRVSCLLLREIRMSPADARALFLCACTSMDKALVQALLEIHGDTIDLVEGLSVHNSPLSCRLLIDAICAKFHDAQQTQQTQHTQTQSHSQSQSQSQSQRVDALASALRHAVDAGSMRAVFMLLRVLRATSIERLKRDDVQQLVIRACAVARAKGLCMQTALLHFVSKSHPLAMNAHWASGHNS